MDISYRWTTIDIPNRKRFAGQSKFNFAKKMNLAMRAVLDFSDKPLELVTLLGFLIFVLGCLAAFSVLVAKISGFEFRSGFPTMFIMLSTGFGLQLFIIGFLAKYIGNIYKEVKRRPLFSIKSSTNINEIK